MSFTQRLGETSFPNFRASAVMMEAVRTCETSINVYKTTWHNNREDSHLLSLICNFCYSNRNKNRCYKFFPKLLIDDETTVNSHWLFLLNKKKGEDRESTNPNHTIYHCNGASNSHQGAGSESAPFLNGLTHYEYCCWIRSLVIGATESAASWSQAVVLYLWNPFTNRTMIPQHDW